MWNENKSCSNGSCYTGMCHWKMMPIMIVMILLIGLWIYLYSNSSADESLENNVENTISVEQGEGVTVNDSKDKLKMVMDEVHAMKNWAMSKVKEIYPDLEYVKQVAEWDNSNLVWMWAEDWLYSKKYDVTVVVCNSLNTPAYVFSGTSLEWADLEKVKTEMKDAIAMMKKDWEMMDWKKWMIEKETKMMDGEVSKWVYTDYSTSAVKNTKWDIVLFFHANWCPTCIATDKDIISKWVPDNLTIFKTDFDTQTELKKKYEVTTQTTFVQVDNQWNMIKKWVWGWLADIVEKVEEK